MPAAYQFDDIKAIVPATAPSWLYIAIAYDLQEEDGSTTKEWADGCLPVLAYAPMTNGCGAYLTNDSEGPSWLYPTVSFSHPGYTTLWTKLHLGSKPERGISPKGLGDEYSYFDQELDAGEAVEFGAFLWIID